MKSSEAVDDFEPDDFTADNFEADDFEPDTPAAKAKEGRPIGQQVLRAGEQVGIGLLEGTPVGMVYDIAVAPLSNKEAQAVNYRENVLSDIEGLLDQKQFGNWSEEDQKHLDQLTEQIKDPEKLLKHVVTTPDLSIRGLAEMATGQDLTPEGWIEKGANWLGFLVGGRLGSNATKIGTSPSEIIKAVMPTAKETFRGAAAGAALQLAEDGQFGPIGTLGMAVAGDLIGHAPTALGKAIMNPKQAAAQAINFLTMNNTRRQIAQQIADDFSKSGLQVDAGTLTQSNLVKFIQARLSQSGLTGDALDNFRKELSTQVIREYENVLGDLGSIAFENDHQAAEAIKDALRVEEVRLGTQSPLTMRERMEGARSLEGRVNLVPVVNAEENLLNNISNEPPMSTYHKGEEIRQAAEEIRAPLREDFNNRFTQINAEVGALEPDIHNQLIGALDTFVAERQGSLLLGESSAEARVLRAAEDLVGRLRTPDGTPRAVSIEDLIKTRRTLADVANWEFGGSNFETAYRGLVGEINTAIDRALMPYPELRNNYLALNADYEQFKRTFENKNVAKVFERNNTNYESLYRDMENNPDKFRSLEEILEGNVNGERILNRIRRDKTENVLSRPNLTQQDIVDLREMLGPQNEGAMTDYLAARLQAAEAPRAAPREALGISVQAPQTQATKGLEGKKISTTGTQRAAEGQRKKLYEELTKQGMKSEDVLKKMNSIEGIRRMRSVLSTTPEGKELFKKLSRYKLAELIDKKLVDNVSGQVRLGKFASLLNDAKSREIVKELVGPEAYGSLYRLQKNAGLLAESAAKFFNASKSGTTIEDMALITTGITGLLSGNPWLVMKTLGSFASMWAATKLLADKTFLKELEKAILSEKPDKIVKFMLKMQPVVDQALQEARDEN